MGSVTYAELKAGTAKVFTTVDVTNPDAVFGYFAFTIGSTTYKTSSLTVADLN